MHSGYHIHLVILRLVIRDHVAIEEGTMCMYERQEYKPNPGTVVVIHFFSERTDGVSLQIKENGRVLSSLGWKVIECSADASGQNSFVLPELDYATPQVQALKVGEKGGLQDEAKMEKDFEQQVQAIKKGLIELARLFKPQVIHVRNILSLPIHPAATVAMAEFIAEHRATGFLAQHHDFSFEDDFQPGDSMISLISKTRRSWQRRVLSLLCGWFGISSAAG